MMTTTNGTSPASSETVLKPQRRRISVAEKLRILGAGKLRHPACKARFFGAKALLIATFDLASTTRTRRSRCRESALSEQRKGDAKAATRRIAELERENRKLRRHVERAELIGEIQKKAARLLGIDLESREPDDEN